MKSGDLFAIASVLRDLTYLSQTKTLSFREQRLLEKAHYLVVSELALVCRRPEGDISERVQQTLSDAFAGRRQSRAAGH
jgi:CarD family transcriptional regulator